MTLPGFGAQSLYLDAGWGVVCVAIALTLLRRRHPVALCRRPYLVAGTIGLIATVVFLPGPYTPTFWLGMAFQYPSLMLVALAGIRIAQILRTAAPRDLTPLLNPLLPTVPAITLLLLAAALYAGAFAILPYDLYVHGYAGYAAAALASVLFVVWCGVGRHGGWSCIALAAAALLHAVTRLPTGNAWDAVLDPFLAAWAAAVVAGAVRRRFRHRFATNSEFLGERS